MEAAAFVGTALNDELYPLIRLRDKAARERMIINCMELVTSRVETFINKVPSAEYTRDDLVSEGYLATVIAVDRLARTAGQKNPTGYISWAIDRAIRDYFQSEEAVAIPARTARRERAAGNVVSKPRRRSDEGIDFHHTWNHGFEYELIEELFACCENERECEVVERRLAGLSEVAIGLQLDISQPTVNKIRQRIQKRYEERNA